MGMDNTDNYIKMLETELRECRQKLQSCVIDTLKKEADLKAAVEQRDCYRDLLEHFADLGTGIDGEMVSTYSIRVLAQKALSERGEL